MPRSAVAELGVVRRLPRVFYHFNLIVHIMSNYWFTTITERTPNTSSDEDRTIADVIVLADSLPDGLLGLALDALATLGHRPSGPHTATRLVNVTRLTNLPPGKVAERPDACHANMKFWFVFPGVPPQMNL